MIWEQGVVGAGVDVDDDIGRVAAPRVGQWQAKSSVEAKRGNGHACGVYVEWMVGTGLLLGMSVSVSGGVEFVVGFLERAFFGLRDGGTEDSLSVYTSFFREDRNSRFAIETCRHGMYRISSNEELGVRLSMTERLGSRT